MHDFTVGRLFREHRNGKATAAVRLKHIRSVIDGMLGFLSHLRPLSPTFIRSGFLTFPVPVLSVGRLCNQNFSSFPVLGVARLLGLVRSDLRRSIPAPELRLYSRRKREGASAASTFPLGNDGLVLNRDSCGPERVAAGQEFFSAEPVFTGKSLQSLSSHARVLCGRVVYLHSRRAAGCVRCAYG